MFLAGQIYRNMERERLKFNRSLISGTSVKKFVGRVTEVFMSEARLNLNDNPGLNQYDAAQNANSRHPFPAGKGCGHSQSRYPVPNSGNSWFPLTGYTAMPVDNQDAVLPSHP